MSMLDLNRLPVGCNIEWPTGTLEALLDELLPGIPSDMTLSSLGLNSLRLLPQTAMPWAGPALVEFGMAVLDTGGKLSAG